MMVSEEHAGRQFEDYFDGHPSRSTPFPLAGRSKKRPHFGDKPTVEAAVREHLEGRRPLSDVDTSTLQSTQPSVTHAGVKHYMSSDKVYKDSHEAGNQVPVIYRPEGTDRSLILSGHHRATAAHFKREPLRALVVEGP